MASRFRDLIQRASGRQRRAGEDGYALLAAVGALALFGWIAFTVTAAGRGGVASAGAIVEQARLAAAAEAGLALAVNHLAARNRADRWSIDARPYQERFDGIRITVRIEDERGKIPLNRIDEAQVRLMFEALGLPEDRVAALTDAFIDWRDDDDMARPLGAEAEWYGAAGVRPRNGDLRSIDELMQIKGFDPDLYARLSRSVTVWPGMSGAFEPANADPLAIAVMTRAGMGSPQVIERQRELAGQRPAQSIAPDVELAGRPLTVRVTADHGVEGRMEQATVIEFLRRGSGEWGIRYRE